MDILPALLTGAAISVGTVAVVMTITTLIGRAQGRVVVVDTAWGLGFVAVAIVAAAIATVADHGEPWRTWLLAAMTAAWGLRLGSHMIRRDSGEEDPRYRKHLGGSVAEVGIGRAIRKVFLVQGVAMAFVAWPVAAGQQRPVTAAWAVALGVVVWAIGLVFEAVGDQQLAAYRRQPRESRPQVLDTGLWRYTRHPNYFGDSAVWWGLWLASAGASGWQIALITVLAPIAMTWFLVAATGARLLEQTMMQRPGYPEYAARTSMFLPRPPKRSGRRRASAQR